MITEFWVWLILLLPLGSFVAIALVVRPFLNRYAAVAGHITVGTVATSLGLSMWALSSVIDQGGRIEMAPHRWLQVGNLDINVGILLDPLTAIMLAVVTGVSLMVQVYSVGYMRGDRGYARYFAFMSLFTASMVGMLLASNIVQMYVFWELVGLCSYLLIGFWYSRPAAAAAAKKAFIVTRIGDFGFLLAILYLFFNADVFASLEISEINEAAGTAIRAGLLAESVVTWIALGIFAGAIGKSGQFPLHVWLPDAMEGPTPVSALIHAATMVAAGVFLVARFFPLFEQSSVAMDTVAIVGGFTALFAATMGLVMNDIKRVLAYSTISQLGYMMLALGIGAYGVAIFHLFTHAFFKALLFMGAGSVNHATGTFDMRYMGGLRKAMPWTYATFLVGGLSLAGIFPFAGFWSKDDILSSAQGQAGIVSQAVFWMAAAAVLMTVYYTVRMVVMTFEGEFRGGSEADPAIDQEEHGVHLAESPLVMAGPLVVLGIASVAAGFFISPPVDLQIVPEHWLGHFLGAETEDFRYGFAALSGALTLAVLLGVYWAFRTQPAPVQRVATELRPARGLLSRKYYFDELYEDVITTGAFYGYVARWLDWADKALVDGVVRNIDRLGRNIGRAMALVQAGQVQGYGVVISIGILVILAFFRFIR